MFWYLLLVADMDRLHCKKGLVIFPSPAGMSLTKLSLAGNNLPIVPVQGKFGQTKSRNLVIFSYIVPKNFVDNVC